MAETIVLFDEEDVVEHGEPGDVHQAEHGEDCHERPAASEAIEAVHGACAYGRCRAAAEVMAQDETQRRPARSETHVLERRELIDPCKDDHQAAYAGQPWGRRHPGLVHSLE